MPVVPACTLAMAVQDMRVCMRYRLLELVDTYSSRAAFPNMFACRCSERGEEVSPMQVDHDDAAALIFTMQ